MSIEIMGIYHWPDGFWSPVEDIDDMDLYLTEMGRSDDYAFLQVEVEDDEDALGRADQIELAISNSQHRGSTYNIEFVDNKYCILQPDKTVIAFARDVVWANKITNLLNQQETP